MKYLIVNADDLGISSGVNRGIMDCHHLGVLTSASLMVGMPASRGAARLAGCEGPGLSVGLHVVLTDEEAGLLYDVTRPDRCLQEILRQLEVFEQLVGRPPTHLDSHHNIHRHPKLLPLFQEVAGCYRLPLREHSIVRYFPAFYGYWGGETHLEQISVESLEWMLATEVGPGYTELSCHPGYVDAAFHSPYRLERETELRTLCDVRIRQAIGLNGIDLVAYDRVAVTAHFVAESR